VITRIIKEYVLICKNLNLYLQSMLRIKYLSFWSSSFWEDDVYLILGQPFIWKHLYLHPQECVPSLGEFGVVVNGRTHSAPYQKLSWLSVRFGEKDSCNLSIYLKIARDLRRLWQAAVCFIR